MKEELIFASLGNRLRELRVEKNLMPRDLAEAIGEPETEIIKLEAGLKAPTLTDLVLLTKRLGVTLSHLFEGLNI
ncbi:helix-turn-helix domain-containing protein [Mucilaginibacter pedocola]|uniref:HTH cro/C1-type domain-containing protein n=1 Tax=Mucilaginibacter pedocola TaxID=1792845 RepID=A0A1S9PHD7_9SPHI|nr:helix-turn-helix transcriptional regulator [Mucilaginibacter pedocola]OOQ60363.1 hypothetical protein BC343_25410 [Mucilaginibacter pedocola]